MTDLTSGPALNPVLEQRLKTLMGIRLVMVTTLLLTAVYVESVSEYLLPFNPFYVLIAATYALTIGHAVALRRARNEALVAAQVIGDLVIITGLVYLTGGGRAGFILLYPISVLAGSVLVRGIINKKCYCQHLIGLGGRG